MEKVLISITIEDMKREDIDEILEIEKVSFSSHWSREAFLTELKERDSSHFLVAKSKGRVAGYAGFWLIIPARSCLAPARQRPEPQAMAGGWNGGSSRRGNKGSSNPAL